MYQFKTKNKILSMATMTPSLPNPLLRGYDLIKYAKIPRNANVNKKIIENEKNQRCLIQILTKKFSKATYN